MMRRACIGAILIWLLLSSGSALAATQKPNLILITLDSARADRAGFLGAKSGLTPNLDRLAAASLVFEHAYAQAPGTLVSHASLLTGSYPQVTGFSEIGGALTPSTPYLPDLLRAQGYRTAAFVGTIELDPANGLAQGFDRGFQTYDAGFRPVIPGDQRPPITHRSKAETVGRAIAWLGHNSQLPFFLWINISDADTGHESYNRALTAADAALGTLFAALKAQKVDTNTAIVVVGDHGQSLGSHGEDTHGIFLYDETIHVPLIVKLPAAQGESEKQAVARIGARITAKVRLVDVAPTLLEIASIPVPAQMQGQSLLRVAKSGGDQPVYSRADLSQRGFGWSVLESWRAGKYLYIRAPKPELYDTTADPAATHNLADISKATLSTMAAQLDAFDRRFSGGSIKTSAELSSSELQKLASLGYVGLQQGSAHSAAATGIDPKDKIAVANKVVEAMPTTLVPARADAAIAALAPIVEKDSGLYLAEYALGVALAQKGRYSEAVKYLHRAIELQPDSSWAHYEIGATLVKTGDYNTAVVHLEIAATRLAGFAPAHTALEEAKEHLGGKK
jgi:arylsulfatase A-like enzyme